MFNSSNELSNSELDTLDHVAITVEDLDKTVKWYTSKFNCTVTYKDKTWAMLKFNNMSLAFVIPDQHPNHIGIKKENAHKFGKLKTHRDGSRSCYIQDPSDNFVEIVEQL